MARVLVVVVVVLSLALLSNGSAFVSAQNGTNHSEIIMFLKPKTGTKTEITIIAADSQGRRGVKFTVPEKCFPPPKDWYFSQVNVTMIERAALNISLSVGACVMNSKCIREKRTEDPPKEIKDTTVTAVGFELYCNNTNIKTQKDENINLVNITDCTDKLIKKPDPTPSCPGEISTNTSTTTTKTATALPQAPPCKARRHKGLSNLQLFLTVAVTVQALGTAVMGVVLVVVIRRCSRMTANTIRLDLEEEDDLPDNISAQSLDKDHQA